MNSIGIRAKRKREAQNDHHAKSTVIHSNGLFVPGSFYDLWQADAITTLEMLAATCINGFVKMKSLGCWASLETLSKLLKIKRGWTKETVRRLIKKGIVIPIGTAKIGNLVHRIVETVERRVLPPVGPCRDAYHKKITAELSELVNQYVAIQLDPKHPGSKEALGGFRGLGSKPPTGLGSKPPTGLGSKPLRNTNNKKEKTRGEEPPKGSPAFSPKGASSGFPRGEGSHENGSWDQVGHCIGNHGEKKGEPRLNVNTNTNQGKGFHGSPGGEGGHPSMEGSAAVSPDDLFRAAKKSASKLLAALRGKRKKILSLPKELPDKWVSAIHGFYRENGIGVKGRVDRCLRLLALHVDACDSFQVTSAKEFCGNFDRVENMMEKVHGLVHPVGTVHKKPECEDVSC